MAHSENISFLLRAYVQLESREWGANGWLSSWWAYPTSHLPLFWAASVSSLLLSIQTRSVRSISWWESNRMVGGKEAHDTTMSSQKPFISFKNKKTRRHFIQSHYIMKCSCDDSRERETTTPLKMRWRTEKCVFFSERVGGICVGIIMLYEVPGN